MGMSGSSVGSDARVSRQKRGVGRGSLSRIIGYSYLLFGYFVLYLPIVLIAVYSFNSAERGTLWCGFTLRWYQELFTNHGLMTVTWHSFVLGFLAAGLATVLGTVIATAVFRYRFLARQALYNMSNVLILMPEIIVAVFLLLLYTIIDMSLGFWSLLIAHVALGVPFVTITVFGRVVVLDSNLIEAATDLGASDWIIWRYVLLPLLWPAIAVGWILSFTLSMDDFMVSYFVGGPNFNILPSKIYSMARFGVRPEINALCTLILLFAVIAILLSYYFLNRKVKVTKI